MEDYYPCHCPYYADKIVKLHCVDLRPKYIKQVFELTTYADFNSITLKFNRKDVFHFIPKDILSNHQVKRINLTSVESTRPVIEFHPESFKSSSKNTKMLLIIGFDLKKTNFSFLSTFIRLENLVIKNSIDVHLSNFPTMSSLKQFISSESTWADDWKNCSSLLKSLENVELSNGGLTNEKIDRILLWIFNPSYENLKGLHLGGNELTRIPRQLVERASNLSKIAIHLSNNKITRFESSDFKQLLENMAVSAYSTARICLHGSKKTFSAYKCQ